MTVGTKNKAATDGISINLNGFELNANIIIDSPSSKFTLTIYGGTVNGNIVAKDAVSLKNITVNGTITASTTCTLAATATVGAIELVGNGVLKATDGAKIGGVEFSVANAKALNVDAVAYVLNYQSKGVYGFYANLTDAVNATAKYYTLVLLENVEVDSAITPVASITLNLNGKTISGTVSAGESLIVNNYGLTITGNGTIAATFDGNVDNSKAANAITNKSTMTVNNGTITLTAEGVTQIGYAIDTLAGASLTVKGGTITASGSGYFDAIRLCCNASKSTTVTVSGGYVSTIWAQNPTANNATAVNGTITVTGGEIGTIYYDNYTTVKITTTIAGNYTVKQNGVGSSNTNKTSKSGKYTVYSF